MSITPDLTRHRCFLCGWPLADLMGDAVDQIRSLDEVEGPTGLLVHARCADLQPVATSHVSPDPGSAVAGTAAEASITVLESLASGVEERDPTGA